VHQTQREEFSKCLSETAIKKILLVLRFGASLAYHNSYWSFNACKEYFCISL